MAPPTRYIVVCEGKSEWTYVQSLNRLFRELPTEAGDGVVPLVLVPKPPPDGVGNGHHAQLVRALKKARKDNQRTETVVWADADLYVCPGRDQDQFLVDETFSTSFRFSAFNFEDFLALHGDNETFVQWKETFSPTGHFSTPLHSKEHLPLFQRIVPGYAKGTLDEDVTTAHLVNLRRHWPEAKSLFAASLPGRISGQLFPDFLLKQIETAFPSVFERPAIVPPKEPRPSPASRTPSFDTVYGPSLPTRGPSNNP